MSDLTEKMRAALRVKTTNFDNEINALIAACKLDLDNAGAPMIEESNDLCVQAITLYCKAYFGFFDDSDNYLERYEALKVAMANSSGYPRESESDGG